jgi:hypothetical protein
MFDLEQEITRWRERLSTSESFAPNHVTELEGHLRDSMEELQARELSVEESFVIATLRLGTGDQLKSEFNKDNLATLWAGRLMWILVGIVFVKIGVGFYLFVSRGIGASVMAYADNARWAGMAMLGTKILLIGIVMYEAWYFLNEKDQRRLKAMDRVFHWGFANPAGTLAVFFVIALIPASIGILHLLDVRAVAHHLLLGELHPFKVHVRQFVIPSIVMPAAKLALVLGMAYWIYRRQNRQLETA